MHLSLMVVEFFLSLLSTPKTCTQSEADALLEDETSEAINSLTIHVTFYAQNKVPLLLSVFKVSFAKQNTKYKY